MPTRSSPHTNRLDTPDTPAIRFTRALNFGAYEFTIATACQFARLPCRIRPGLLPAHRRLLLPGFRPGRSPPQPLDMTTTSIELLCRRDLHPLESQLV